MPIAYIENPSGDPFIPAKKDGDVLVICCPFCSRQHTHGAASYGHRQAHCADLDIHRSRAPLKAAKRRGYYLIAA